MAPERTLYGSIGVRLSIGCMAVAALIYGWLSPVAAVDEIGPPATLSAPQKVAVGEPFLVRFSSSEKLDAVTITWGDWRIRPSITASQGTHLALAMLGTGLDAKTGSGPLIVSAQSDGKLRTYQKRITIVPKKFPREALSVAPQMNKPPAEILGRIRRELAAMRQAQRTVSPERRWQVPFHRPVKGVMLSRFGLRRTFNKETKRRHYGLDFRAPQGTDIAAIAAGRVALVGNFYLPGNTVVIDHGNGIVSTYMHLSKVLVSVGNAVERGQVFGRSGATGRVTGAHLHLSVSVQGTAVDPAPLFDMGAPSEGLAVSLNPK